MFLKVNLGLKTLKSKMGPQIKEALITLLYIPFRKYIVLKTFYYVTKK